MESKTDGTDKENGEAIGKKDSNIVKEPFSMTKSVKNLMSFFTVEPYLLCYILSNVICSVGIIQLNMEKACRVDLNYTEEVCCKVVAGDTSDNETLTALIGASTLVADMTAWKEPLQTGIPAIFILFLGAWSDRTGNRKSLLLVPIVGEILSVIGLILGTYYFLECPLWAMGLIQDFSSTFTGGLPVALMGSYSYIADVTTPESRTFRMGMVTVFATRAIPLGTAMSGVLIQAIGYYGIFGIAIALYVTGFIHTLYRIHDIRRNNIEGTFWYKLGQFIHPRHVWDTLSLLFLSRGRALAQILLVIWAHIVIMGPVYGEVAILYLYTMNRYNMDIVDLGLFITYYLMVGITGTSIAVTVFSKWLKWHDSILGLIATTSKVLSSLLYALAPTRNWFFVGPILDCFGNSGGTAIRSLGTKVVDQDKVGKMCSLIGFVDAILPRVYMPLYSKLLENTLSTFPGAVYFLGAAMTVPDYVIFIVLYIYHRKEQRDTVQNPESKEMHAYENAVTNL